MLRLLLGHPDVEIGALTGGSNAGERLGALQPHLLPLADRVLEPRPASRRSSGHDVVFLGLPHGQSGESPRRLGDDSRWSSTAAPTSGSPTPRQWEKFYGGSHAGLLALRPARARRPARACSTGARRIAVPGCYPTVSTLPSRPRCRAGLVEPDVVVVAATGTSGAGKAAKPQPARQRGRWATPRLRRRRRPPAHPRDHAEPRPALTDGQVRVSFTPLLVPMPRGILATVSAPLHGGVTDEQTCARPTQRRTPTSRSCTCCPRASGRRPRRSPAPTPCTSRSPSTRGRSARRRRRHRQPRQGHRRRRRAVHEPRPRSRRDRPGSPRSDSRHDDRPRPCPGSRCCSSPRSSRSCGSARVPRSRSGPSPRQPLLDHRDRHRDQPDLRDPVGADQDAEHQAAHRLPGAAARSTPTRPASWPACSRRWPRRRSASTHSPPSTPTGSWSRLVDAEKATEAWRRQGHTVTAPSPPSPSGSRALPERPEETNDNERHPSRRLHRRRRRRRPEVHRRQRPRPRRQRRAPRSTPPASSPPTAARPTRSCGARRSSRTASVRRSSSTPAAPTATPAPTASRPRTPSPSGSPSSLGIGAIDVVVCSTGLIGLGQRPRRPPGRRRRVRTPHSSPTAEHDAAEAIMTTDSVSQAGRRRGRGLVHRRHGQGRRACSPRSSPRCSSSSPPTPSCRPPSSTPPCAPSTRVSFDRLDSDGCMSTNDTVTVMASGASGITPAPRDFTERAHPGLHRPGDAAAQGRRGRRPRDRDHDPQRGLRGRRGRGRAAASPAATCSRRRSSARTPTGAGSSPASAPPRPPSTRPTSTSR